MSFESKRNDGDRVTLTDNAEEVEPSQENDIVGVISNHRPRKNFIEPAVILLFAAFTLYETVIPNTIEVQFCRAVLNISEDQCLRTTKENLEKLQQFTNRFQLFRSFIEVTIPSFISFFVGPWSDTYGRKPLILSALVGYSATYMLWTFGSSLPNLEPFYFLLFSLPLAFSGGSTTFILGIFCYVCDVTTLENRGARLGRLQGALFFGALIGTRLCPKLLPWGYTFIFGVSSGLLYISLFYIYFFLDESIVPSQVELNSPKKNPFHFSHVKELFESCYTKQTPKVRLTLFILTLILACSLINVFGETGVLYLFLQNVLGWGLKEYTTLSSFIIIVNAIGAYGGTWLLCYKLQLDDLLVLSIAAFARILSALVMIFGYQIWHIYFAKFLSCTLGISGSIIRSFLSRIVAKDELGKVFSLLASTEATTPLFASLMYNTLYSATLDTFPGAIFYLSAILVLAMLLFLTILVQMYVANPKPAPPRNPYSVSQNDPAINTS